MRISRIWIRPILTAALFPVAFVGALWGLDEFSGEEWLPWSRYSISSDQAKHIAETKCFSPYYLGLKPWHSKLNGHVWVITGQDTGRYVSMQRHTYAWVYAGVDTNTGELLSCGGGVV